MDSRVRHALTYDHLVSVAIAFVSLDSFLDQEGMSERRHELVGGRV